MRPIEWTGTGLILLDQTRLPGDEAYIETDDYKDVVAAIKTLAVRGAPAIGVAAAYGLALVVSLSRESEKDGILGEVEEAAVELESTRPTAVNLKYALDRVLAAAAAVETAESVKQAVVNEAIAIHKETESADRVLSEYGAALIDDGDTVLTICNTGALATGGYGTALGVIRRAWESGKNIDVIACETRPLLQGARLNMWELDKYGIPAIQIVDAAAASYMKRGKVQKVIAGADRIAANGDTANKIGTYALACLAERHSIPFYIAAPGTTVDLATAEGGYIEIEERARDEVTSIAGVMISPRDALAGNPAFDVTPAGLITAIITDGGLAAAPYKESLPAVLAVRAKEGG
jgi:methylthioribose-1-phosphate isomerase